MLKIGIVGAGVMGNRHEGRVADYGAQVVAVHDIHLRRHRNLGREQVRKSSQMTLSGFLMLKWMD